MASHASPDPQGGHGVGHEPAQFGDPADLGKTRRERLCDLLFSSEEGVSLDQIEKILEARRATVIDDLEHLRLSFRHRQATLLMVPPTCESCGYTFRLEAPKAPSKCPACKSRDLTEPIFKAEAEA